MDNIPYVFPLPAVAPLSNPPTVSITSLVSGDTVIDAVCAEAAAPTF